MTKSKKYKLVALAVLSMFWLSKHCLSDEIAFKDQAVSQIGTILNEDEQNVTIRFSRDVIRSISKDQKGLAATSSDKVIWEDSGDYFILKIPRQYMQIKVSETQSSASSIRTGSPATGALSPQEGTVPPGMQPIDPGAGKAASEFSDSSKVDTAHQKLLQEEMGGVKGTISWQGKLLENAKVKITLDSYTGFSISAVKRMLSGDKEDSPTQVVSFETQTDSQGRYSFPKVPPGFYRLYWQPDSQTGYVRRLRENPDFEVTSGKFVVQDIPEKKR